MACCVCVSTSTVGIVERLGKFDRLAQPGCHCLNPATETLTGRVSLRITPLYIDCPSKTRDNVIVTVKVNVQYHVLPDSAADSYYSFSNPTMQITSFVTNVIRGQVPVHTLDEVYLLREEMEKAIKGELDAKLARYGFKIVAALICDISPNDAVKQSMNQILTNARLKTAIEHKSEALKIEVIKAAEADAEAKRLSGVGLAEQRKAVIQGLQASVSNFSHVHGMTPKDVMGLLLMNQYFDTIKEVSEISKGKVVLLPGGDSTTVMQQMVTAAAASA